jgi:uncharacterized membrane protein/mono/diheme cytochrome c family protein
MPGASHTGRIVVTAFGWQLIGFSLLACTSVPSRAVAAPGAGLGDQARNALAAKCAECHSSRLSHSTRKFGYVLDVKRLASNPRLVVPFHPRASRLWTKIEDGDMPPNDARAGDLTDAEKRSIRRWIEAGAPPALTPAPMDAMAGALADAHSLTLARRILREIGRLHVLVVHFPIALLAAAAIAESWWAWRGRAVISPVVRFCVVFGALGAIAAGVLGWIHASFGGFGTDSGQVLMLHRWLGTAAAAGAVVTALAGEWDVFRNRRSVLFRGVLFTSALLVGVAGHFGGMLVYGSDFFRF